jgi:chaperonin GroEL
METILTGTEARSKLLVGVNKVANSIKGTHGPNARTVIIQNPIGMPVILNDGVSIARAVHDKDPYVQMGIDLLKEVASEAQEKSGDGTTTATLIAQTLCNGSLSLMEKGTSPLKIRDEFKKYLEDTIEYLKNETSYDFDLKDVATIAANNDEELGSMISDVVTQVGSTGAITIEKSPTTDTYIRESSGVEVNSGYAHALMANAPRGKCILEKPLVVCTTEKLETFNTLLPSLEIAVGQGRPIIFFCSDYNPQMIQNLLVNIVQGKVSACIVKPSGMHEQKQAWLEDIAALTGAKLFSTTLKETMNDVTEDSMGDADRIEASARTTVISRKSVGNKEHLDTLRENIDEAEHEWLAEQINNRLSRLTTGISTIYVGGATEVEQVERKERVDDAVNACRLALESGVVIGGGTALYHAAQALREAGYSGDVFELFENGLLTPLTTIRHNSGSDMVGKIVLFVGDNTYVCGKTGQYRNAKEDGVYDPVNVVINSLESAVSVAALVLMTDAAIIAPKE